MFVYFGNMEPKIKKKKKKKKKKKGPIIVYLYME